LSKDGKDIQIDGFDFEAPATLIVLIVIDCTSQKPILKGTGVVIEKWFEDPDIGDYHLRKRGEVENELNKTV